MATSKISGKFRIETYEYKYNISGNSNIWISKTNLGMTPISGWRLAGVLCVAGGSDNIVIRAFNLTAENILNFRNLASSAQSDRTATLIVLYLPE